MGFTLHGGPPVSLSLSEFEWDVSVPRNLLLGAVFCCVRLIEAYGTGIKRIFEAYEGSGVSPEFSMSSTLCAFGCPAATTKATTRSGSADDSAIRLNSNAFGPSAGAAAFGLGASAGDTDDSNSKLRNQERLVLAALEEFGPQRRAELQERFEFSQATVLRVLGRLKDKGLVRVEGNTRRRVYRAVPRG